MFSSQLILVLAQPGGGGNLKTQHNSLLPPNLWKKRSPFVFLFTLALYPVAQW